jgi:hypothetical protein
MRAEEFRLRRSSRGMPARHGQPARDEDRALDLGKRKSLSMN